MFYFFLATGLIYNWILIVAAVVPAILLMFVVYKSDRIDKETPQMLWSMVKGGVLSALVAMVLEWVLCKFLDLIVSPATNLVLYNVLLYFIIVAFSEEGAKFFFLRRRSWMMADFDCLFDGIVYAVFTSLGFALWENISYVLHFGLSTAIVRAVTAIPGHACFGVFMGVFYSLAKGCAYANRKSTSQLLQVCAVVIPALLHGAYDYIASSLVQKGSYLFIVFIAILFIISFILVRRMSKNDAYFRRYPG